MLTYPGGVRAMDPGVYAVHTHAHTHAHTHTHIFVRTRTRKPQMFARRVFLTFTTPGD